MFSPYDSLLLTTKENTPFSLEITYVDEFGTSHPVTITPSETDPTVTVAGGTITGKFTQAFDTVVNYRVDDFNVAQVTSLPAVPEANRPKIYYLRSDGALVHDFTFTASANNETATYTISVVNDYNVNRNLLLQYINPSAYAATAVVWINNSDQVVPWLNTSGTTVNWGTDNWPWQQ